MIVYVNSNNEIKGVGSTADATLIPIEITDGTFDNWSIEKICCYKVNVTDGHVTMLTPYVDSRMIEHFDRVSTQTEEVQTTVSSNYDANKTYTKDEYCMFNGNLYRFKQNLGRNIEPTNATYWTLCDVATELNRIMDLVKER